MRKIAILDDYIGVALEYGDWSALPEDAEITVYREAIAPARLVDELSGYEVVVITQQRARFPRPGVPGGIADPRRHRPGRLPADGASVGPR